MMTNRIYWFVFAFALAIAVFAPASAAARGPHIVVPTRDIARGEVVTLADLASVPVAVGVQPGSVMSMKQIVGLETRRALRTGESLRAEDFRHPIVVTKGALVTMTYDVPGVSLTASMRAIAAGGVGEMVTVQNPVSYRSVGAVVTGPGQVRALNSAGAEIAADGEAVSQTDIAANGLRAGR